MFLLALIASSLAGQAYVIVAGFNRLNAQGWNRKLIKLSEKIHILTGIILPNAFLIMEWYSLSHSSKPYYELTFFDLQSVTQIYMIAMTTVALIFTPMWLSIRPQFVVAKNRYHVLAEQKWKTDTLDSSPYSNSTTKLLGRVPRNEIAWTDANHKTILIDRLPDSLNGLKIAHLSDIHLTGQLSHEFYHRAFDWITAQQPDLVIVAGDIVDYDQNLEDIEPVFQRLSAQLGSYFILGNHDKRLTDPTQICKRLEAIGWRDAGATQHMIRYKSLPIEIIGNEKPWFDRYGSGIDAVDPETWRLGIAHSPDQFSWGVENGCSLLLCGHTHGGQIRFPVFGPLVAPSMHGSKYASGVFYRNGTLMHVSRGMAGVHPLRWGCPPEVSILHLSSA
ncbi:MAG: metallophosphoesterase [Pirellula sp.]